MDEESIFGPLTFRQFLYGLAGFGIARGLYEFLDLSLSVPLIIAVAGVTFAVIKNSPAVVIDESYITKKRYRCKNVGEFQTWLKMRITLIQSQIALRSDKNLTPDARMADKLKMFEKALQNSNST